MAVSVACSAGRTVRPRLPVVDALPRTLEVRLTDPVTLEPGLRAAMTNLESILVRDEVVQAWASQRRLFALMNRRLLLVATTSRLISLRRGWFGGFEYTDLRWQDLKEAHISVGVLGATLRVVAETSSDLAISQSPNRTLVYAGLRPEQAQAVYRICQAQDQAWREKRRIRELEELRARSGGIQVLSAAAAPAAGAEGDAVRRLREAKRSEERRVGKEGRSRWWP